MISEPGMGPYPLRVALAPRTQADHCGWGFHTVRGGIDPGDHRFRPRPMCRSCRGMAGFLIRGCELILPGLHFSTNFSLKPISNKPMVLGFPHRVGRYRPGGSPFSSPVCWSCKYMEGFLSQGWIGCDLILPVWHWLREPEPQSAISQ